MRNQVLIGLGIIVGILCFLGACRNSKGLDQGDGASQNFDTTYTEVPVENIMVPNARSISQEDGIILDDSYSIGQIEAYDKGYVLMSTGRNQQNANVNDIYYVRLNSAGEVLEITTYDDGFMEQFNGHLGHSGEHFYATSTTFIKSRAHNDFHIIKFDEAGKLLWSHAAEEVGFQIPGPLLATEDAVYCFGRTIQANRITSELDLMLVKLSQDGSTLGSKVWGSPVMDFAYGIESLNDSLLLLLSIQRERSAKWLYLSGMDTALNLKWNKKVTEVTGDNPDAQMIKLPNGDIYIQSQIAVDSFGYQILLSKLSPNGELLWNKAYGLEEKGKSMMRIDRRAFIHPSVNGNILMAGNTGTIYGTGTHYIFELNSEGEVQWASSIPSPYGYLMDITTKTDKSGYILTGYQRKSLDLKEKSKGYLMSIDLQGQTAPF